MSDTFDIGRPGPGTGAGSGFNSTKADHVGHLLVFVRPVVETRTNAKGEPYDVARCDYVLCTKDMGAWADHAVSGAALVPKLTTAENTIVSGTLALGEAKASQSPPYLLEDPTDDELAKIQELFAKFAIKMPTGKVVVDIDAFGNQPF
jgi:hypothetical protein